MSARRPSDFSMALSLAVEDVIAEYLPDGNPATLVSIRTIVAVAGMLGDVEREEPTTKPTQNPNALLGAFQRRRSVT